MQPPSPSRTGRQVHLSSRPRGEPRETDFRVVETAVPPLRAQELLVRNHWMSLDPSMRIRMHAAGGQYMGSFELGRPLDGWAVGEVVEARTKRFAVGDHVLHRLGWRDYAVLSATAVGRTAPERIEVSDTTPERAYLGPLGWVGLTSYVGLLDVAELRDGDVVFVSGAAGAVGSLAVQIAKLKGHRVIGSAGSAAKVAFVRTDLGADEAFCYRDGEVAELLRAAAPEGIDVYFDNVGGDHLEAALDALRVGGRVALCGAISTYNATAPVRGPANLFNAVAKGLTLRGFLAGMYAHRMAEFRAEMRRWLSADRIVYRETIFEGLERAPGGLIALLRGENIGKVLVRLV
jgi:NADPH-dependent curcumin reductase CurA